MDIFIVEDEYWALEEMKTLLAEYQKNHNLHFYENGEDAYAELHVYHPELIITDITMPVMDGLELIEKVKEFDPSIQCILLTVHDTFEYAKKGIQLGVVEYLLKPIKKDALYEIMDTTMKKINRTKMDETDKQLWSINQLIFNQLGMNEQNKGTFENQSFYFVYFLFGNWQAHMERETDINGYLEKKGVAAVSWLLSLDEQRKLLVIPSSSTSLSFVTELYSYINKHEQVHLCYAVKEKNNRLIETFQTVHQLMEQNKHYGISTLITESQLTKEKDISELWTIVRVIEEQIRQGNLTSLSQQLDYMINQIERIKMTQKQLFQFLLDMYYAILYKLQQSTSRMVRIENVEEEFAKLDTLVTFGQLRNWLEHLIKLVMNVTEHEAVAPKYLIPKVKEWVAERYFENITFQEFAEEHHVSLSYLSREFKEQTGMTFKDYLTNYRIRKAEELFQNGVESTTEAGILSGYSDPKHYRKVFKKVTGKSPKEYRSYL